MKMNHKLTLGLFILVLTNIYSVYSQTVITLDQPEIGSQEHVANTEINFQKGYHYSPLTATMMNAYIDGSITGDLFTGGINGSFDDRDINTNLSVGTIDGKHGVSSSGGAFYSIPILLPPGTGGVAPELSVNYNSQVGNGLLGMGWLLGAGSVISRVPKTIYHDSEVASVQLNSSDVFALDGNRLFSLTGIYGEDGTIYGTEKESFNKITSYGILGDGPSWFKVETKNGMTFEYGNTTDSRFVNNSVLSWHLSKVIDNYGNYYTYSYRLENDELLIDKIEYGGNLYTNVAHYNEVQFVYNERQDKNTVYVANTAKTSNVVLNKIRIQSEGIPVRMYEFKYGYNIYSYLTEIIEYGSNGGSYNSTIFKYGDINNSISEEPIPPFIPTNPNASDYEFWSGDYNGDGLTDLLGVSYALTYLPPNPGMPPVERTWLDMDLYINNGDESFTKTANIPLPNGFSGHDAFYPKQDGHVGSSSLENIDFNGDGLPDLLFIVPASTGSGYDLYPYFSTGNTFVQQPSINIPTSGGGIILKTFDADGDGKTEVFINYKTGSQTYKCELIFNLNKNDVKNCSQDYGLVMKYQKVYQTPKPQESNYPPGTIEYDDSGNQYYTPNPQYTQDLQNWYVTWNGGALPYILVPTGVQGLQYEFQNSYVIDENGDGKYSLANVYFNHSSGSHRRIMSYNESNGLQFSYFSPEFEFEPFIDEDRVFGDFNGDLKTDVIYTYPSPSYFGWYYKISSDDSYHEVGIYDELVSPYSSMVKHFVKDVNGDGKSDIIEIVNTQDSPWDPVETVINLHYSNGVDFIKKSYPVSFPIDLKFDHIVFGDYNGDDKIDIMFDKAEWEAVPTYRILYFEENSKERFLHSIKDGFNNETQFTYDYLTNTSIYSKGSSSNYPVNDIQAPLSVVSSVIIDDGIGGENVTTYQYEQARMHKQGRGFLGFKKVIAENNLSNIRVINEYELNSTYFVTHPTKEIREMIGGVSLTEKTFTHNYASLGNKRYFLKLNQVTEKDQRINFTTTTDLSYDVSGNIELAYINKGNIETIIKENEYGSYGNWGVDNKRTKSIITTTRNGDPNAFIQVEDYGYNAKGSVIEKINNIGTTKALTTDYGYNSFGNRTLLSVSATGLTPRTTTYIFDDKGRFPVEKVNPLNQHSYVDYDSKWGLPIAKTGVDGLTTTYEYDEFGRLTKVITPDNIITETALSWEIGGGSASNPLAADNSIYTVTTTTTGKPQLKTWYDSFGRTLKTETDGLDEKKYQIITYDERGNIETSTSPFYNGGQPVVTTNSYNIYNQIVNSQNSAGATSYSYAYNTSDHTFIAIKNLPDGTTNTLIKDGTGKEVKAIDAGGVLSYNYYSSGLLKEVQLDGVQVSSMEYDEYGYQTQLTDPNAGVTEYDYNAYGELIYQKDAKNNEYEMTYDVLGRIETKTENNNLTTNYSYYTSGNGINQTEEVTYNGITKHFNYDDLGRLTEQKEIIDATDYVYQYEYDNLNRLQKMTYPSGFKTQHNYNSVGYPISIKNEQGTITIWEAGEMNAYDQFTSYHLGNGITTVKEYDDYGLLKKIKTPQETDIQDIDFTFDPQNGNLLSQHDLTNALLEEYDYDDLNRLIETKVNGVIQNTMTYQSNGNISSKTDAGNYLYHVNKKNAAVRVTDPNNNISTNNQLITYNAFNSINTIVENNKELTFLYGADQQRRKMEYKHNGALQKTIYYLGNYEKIEKANGDVTELHYIPGGDGLAAIHVINTPSTQSSTHNTYYTYTDHLGSILTITNDDATNIYKQNFDAWGRYRDPFTLAYTPHGLSSTFSWITRGYTGHEHLADFGIINMNGRLYDPIVGRMLSPDNYVQSPLNTQSYNRYSYVINNPLKYTDPTGENWLSDALNWVKDKWNDAWDAINGTPNPETGQYEGGLAQQVPGWVPDGIGFGVNSSGQTFHYTHNGAPVYHHYNAMATPGINWAEVNAARELDARMTAFWNDQVGGYDYVPEVAQNGENEIPSWVLNNIAKAGITMNVSSEVVFSKTANTWIGKDGKIRSQNWGGNGTTGGKYSFAKKVAGKMKFVGSIMGAYGIYDTYNQYMSKQISKNQMMIEQTSNGIGFIPLIGTSWSIGWETGKAFGPSKWYGDDDNSWFK